MREEPKRLNFTKKALEALPTDKGRRTIWHDTYSQGLQLRIEPNGRKSFCWFRKVNGVPTWKHIGLFPDLSVENARTKAAEFNSRSARWKADEYEGDNPFQKRRDLTLGVVLDDYLERRVKSHSKNPDVIVKRVRWQFDHYVASWRDRRLGTITDRDVANLHHELGRKTKVLANRVVQFLRTLFNWARDEMHWSGENPVKRKFKFFAEAAVERFLQAEELPRLFEALAAEPQRDLQHFVILALFTGARRGDVLSMRWENIDFETTTWRVPNPKSRKPYIVPLMPEVMSILKERLQGSKSPWVFPGAGKSGHLAGFTHSWATLLKRANIQHFRIHDLRHTLASWQVAGGTSLPIIGKSLGHSTSAMTERYAKLNVDPVREAVERATRAMLTAGKKSD